ncbi:unnamed protein product [Aphanomyces euteiches]
MVYIDESYIHHHYSRLEIFQGGMRQPKDYHAMFTHDFFVDWFTDLLDQLDDLQIYGVIFAMDNAKYHRGKTSGTPSGSMKKADILEACQKYGVVVDSNATKPVVGSIEEVSTQFNIE